MGGLSGMSGLGGMRQYATPRDLKPLTGVEALKDIQQQQVDDESRLKDWISRVGEGRARMALDVLKMPRSEGGYRSTTLPELLTEGWLKARQVAYVAQLDLGWARPDFVLPNTLAGGAMVWRVQGNYWHGTTTAKDAAQKEHLLKSTARGQAILRVIDLWESQIYQSEGVFDAALRGEEIGP